MSAKFWQPNWIYPPLPVANFAGWNGNYVTAMFLSPALDKVPQQYPEAQCIPTAIFQSSGLLETIPKQQGFNFLVGSIMEAKN